MEQFKAKYGTHSASLLIRKAAEKSFAEMRGTGNTLFGALLNELANDLQFALEATREQ